MRSHMKPVTHYKPNLVYELLIHENEHYVGCHTSKMSYLTEKSIVLLSGNYLWVEAYRKKTITNQEYRDSVKLLRVVEFDTREEALEYEPKAIQECKEKYEDLCVNVCKGNKYTTQGLHTNLGRKQSPDSVTKRITTIKEKYANGYVSPRKGKSTWNKGIHTGIKTEGMKGKHHTDLFKQEQSKRLKDLFWFTDGTTTIRAKECPIGFRRGRK